MVYKEGGGLCVYRAIVVQWCYCNSVWAMQWFPGYTRTILIVHNKSSFYAEWFAASISNARCAVATYTFPGVESIAYTSSTPTRSTRCCAISPGLSSTDHLALGLYAILT